MAPEVPQAGWQPIKWNQRSGRCHRELGSFHCEKLFIFFMSFPEKEWDRNKAMFKVVHTQAFNMVCHFNPPWKASLYERSSVYMWPHHSECAGILIAGWLGASIRPPVRALSLPTAPPFSSLPIQPQSSLKFWYAIHWEEFSLILVFLQTFH